MRDSSLKQFLVQNYFGLQALGSSLRAMWEQPRMTLLSDDYERYWEFRGEGGMHPRFTIIGSQLESGCSLLDVGCGDGTMLEYLARERNVVGRGIDISELGVLKARARGVEAEQATFEEFSARSHARFEHVVLSEIIEHVPNPEKLVLSAWKVCTRSLWLTIPNIAYLPHRLRLLAGKFPVQWVYYPGEHLRFWSIPDFTRWLDALEFPKATFHPSNGISILGAHRVWPNLFANQIVVRIDRA